jgi:hypothetical protein
VRRILPVVLFVAVCAGSLPEAADAKNKSRCRGRLATIVGTKHADRITGTKNMIQEPNCFSANPCPP